MAVLPRGCWVSESSHFGAVLCHLGSNQEKRDKEPLEEVQKRPQGCSEGWSNSPVKKRLRDLGTSSLEKRMLQGDLTAAFLYLKGIYKRDAEQLLTESDSDRTRSDASKL